MRLKKLKPASGLSHFVHLFLTVLLPVLVFVLVRVHFIQLALVLILLSKWRMFAVKPRHWPANIRASSIDIIVGVSVLVFMMHSSTQLWQLVWAGAYGVWLIFIKPGSGEILVSLQAMIGQLVGLMALFMHFSDAPIIVLTVLSWLICGLAARHFFTSFDEPLTRLYSYTWGYFGAALTWLLSHWLLYYGVLAQPTLLLSVIGFGLATLYYLEGTDRLSKLVVREFVFVMVAVVVIVLALSDWVDKAI